MALTVNRQWNTYCAYELQGGGIGVPASGAGAHFIVLSGGTGNVTQTPINSILVRQDGMSLRGRGGTFATAGQYPGELNMGNYDPIFEAALRGSFVPGGSLGGHILTMPAAGALVRRYFTIEEVELDLGVSQVYSDCVFTKFDMSAQPNGMFIFTPYWMGTGFSTTTTGAAFNFTSPSYSNNNFIPLAAIDMTVALGPPGFPVMQMDITSFQLTYDLGATVPAVTGTKYSPDVFDGVAKISVPGFTIMESSLTAFNDFIDETELSLIVTVTEPNPGTGIMKFTIPNMTLGQATKSEMKRDGGPLTRNIQVPDARVGIDLSGGPNPATMMIIERNT
jgi:Phage tail tube protein